MNEQYYYESGKMIGSKDNSKYDVFDLSNALNEFQQGEGRTLNPEEIKSFTDGYISCFCRMTDIVAKRIILRSEFIISSDYHELYRIVMKPDGIDLVDDNGNLETLSLSWDEVRTLEYNADTNTWFSQALNYKYDFKHLIFLNRVTPCTTNIVNVFVHNIDWDLDDLDGARPNLPSYFILTFDESELSRLDNKDEDTFMEEYEEFLADKVTERFGFCQHGFTYID